MQRPIAFRQPRPAHRVLDGRVAKLQLVGDLAADALLNDNPMALLIGVLLDQQ